MRDLMFKKVIKLNQAILTCIDHLMRLFVTFFIADDHQRIKRLANLLNTRAGLSEIEKRIKITCVHSS